MIGDTAVRLRGSHPLVALVTTELEALATTAPPKIELSVHDHLSREPSTSVTEIGPVAVGAGVAWCSFPRSGLRAMFQVDERAGDVRIEVAVGTRPTPLGMPRRLFRWAEPTFMSPLEAQAYVFLLRLVEGSVFLFGGRTGLLHASCVERAGRALALTAAGGAGKTTIAARLLRQPGWRYLTDDVLPVTEAPWVHHYPRKCMVYAYNVADDGVLRDRLLDHLGVASSVQWRALQCLGVRRRRRRVAPAELFGAARVGSRARLDTVAFLSRGGDAHLRIDDAEAGDLARRCRSIMANEQAVLGQVIRCWEAAGRPPVPFEEALDRHEALYRAAFARARRLVHVRLPHTGGFEHAASVLSALVEE